MLSQSISPAVKQHMEVQLSFLNDMSKKMFDFTQKIIELNIHLTHEVLEEVSNGNHQLLQAKDASEFASTAVTQIHPTTEKLRNYQQSLSSLVAGTQVELTKTAESHLPEATRTAAAVADEIARTATEETEKASQRQRAALEKMNTAAQKTVDGSMKSQNQFQNQKSQQSPTH